MSDQPQINQHDVENQNNPNEAHAPATDSTDFKDKLAAMMPGLCMIAMLIALVVWGLLDTR
jgi:hypothetical protein